MLKLLKKYAGFKLSLLALVGFFFALISVLFFPGTPTKQPIVSPPVSPYADNIAGIGVVEPKSEIINIGTELSGVVREVPIKVGDDVKEGDPLFILDQRDIDAQIRRLKAAVDAAKAQVEDAKAQYTLVKGAQDGRAVAKDDYNRRQYNLQLMLAKLDEALAELNQAETTKARLTVRSPINGQVLNINIRRGEFAQAGFLSEPLMRLGDMTTRHVRVEIDEENAIYVNPSAVAKGFKRGNPEHAINLTFVRVEPYVRPKQNLAVSGQRVDTRVLQVIYALPDIKSLPFIGEQMDVYIENTKGRKR